MASSSTSQSSTPDAAVRMAQVLSADPLPVAAGEWQGQPVWHDARMLAQVAIQKALLGDHEHAQPSPSPVTTPRGVTVPDAFLTPEKTIQPSESPPAVRTPGPEAMADADLLSQVKLFYLNAKDNKLVLEYVSSAMGSPDLLANDLAWTAMSFPNLMRVERLESQKYEGDHELFFKGANDIYMGQYKKYSPVSCRVLAFENNVERLQEVVEYKSKRKDVYDTIFVRAVLGGTKVMNMSIEATEF